VKRFFQVTLGILTAIGGFVDIGDLVANAATGARFGMTLAWAVLVGVGGILLFAEMAGRVATVSGRAVFDLVRERLGPRVALANLVGSMAVTFLTLTAEIGGIALALELATSVNYLLFVPVCAALVWIVLWRVRFETMERVFGLAGLALVMFVVALWRLHPDWHGLLHQARDPFVPSGEGHPTYFYWAIALFGAAMTPYEVFFFSSGAVEERWTRKDLMLNRANVYVGFPLGGILSLAIMGCAATVLRPASVEVGHLSQVGLPVVVAVGRLGLVAVLLGFIAATAGAALETALSTAYSISQFFGWSWGKFVRPSHAPLFHLTLLVTVVLGAAVALTSIDPIKITEYSIVFSAVALPLTYFPILVIANDPDYLGDKTNSGFTNTLATVYLVLIAVAAFAAIPLMLATKAGA
jgi:Mn2+/Fe2+ NRAMP family transporter